MNRLISALMAFACAIAVAANARADERISEEITTPDHVQSKVGDLDFKDGLPTQETANKIRDEIDYINGVHAFMNSIPRTSFFYTATGITPAMSMRLEGIGSQYLVANVDKNGKPFDGSKIYKVVLPKRIPAARFWSFTVYDSQSRSMLQTPQLYPRAGSQSHPSPAAAPNADGSTTIYFSPKQPQGVEKGKRIQTDPEALAYHPASLQSVAVFLR